MLPARPLARSRRALVRMSLTRRSSSVRSDAISLRHARVLASSPSAAISRATRTRASGRAQLVGDVGQELLLGADQTLQTLRHLVEGVREVAHFVPALILARAPRSPLPKRSTVRVSFSSGDVIWRASGIDPRARKARITADTLATWSTCGVRWPERTTAYPMRFPSAMMGSTATPCPGPCR